MVNLEHQDFKALLNALVGLDVWDTASSRRKILLQAGLGKLIPNINFGGDTDTFVTNLVSFLANFGRISYENEALGQLLNLMKLKIGVVEQQLFDQLLVKYHMMEPIAPPQPMSEWRSPESDEDTMEKIIGENTLRPVAFLARGLQVSRSVALISVRSTGGAWVGTGFMVTPKLILTNHHVVSEAGLLPGVTVRFNCQQDLQGRDEPVAEFAADPNGFFHANKQLDYALFEVKGAPGEAWGYVPLKSRNLKNGDRINVIQHPGGQPKQISMQNNMVQAVGGSVLQYVTSTLPGSSGSPVFNDNWEAVGLHHAGGLLADPNNKTFFNRNEGILINKILADLPTQVRQAIDAAAAEIE